MSLLSLFNRANGPRIERIRHDPRRRTLRVRSTERITPGMARITLEGDDLSDFHSVGFDDHLKVFVPGAGERRDYTPRRYDRASRTLTLDFAIHDAGPATLWAISAKPGDQIEIGGPKSSSRYSDEIRRWLLIGDETGLPAIGRHLEEARAGVEVTTVVAVAGPEEKQAVETRADHTGLWAYRPPSAASDSTPLLDIVLELALQPDTFVWIAAEATVARAVRNHLVEERGHPLAWLKAGGYWVKGRPAGKERIG